MHRLLRFVNRLNPSHIGRHRIMRVAESMRWLPTAGEYRISSDVTMAIDPEDYGERAIYFDSFEFLPRRCLLTCLPPGTVFVDVGANVGFYTLLASQRVLPTGRVIAFEPNPRVAARLRHNLEINPLSSRVEVFELALLDRSGQSRLYVPSGERPHGEASLRPTGESAEEYEVATSTLDDVLGDTVVNTLKIDAEGSELAVLRGAERIIRRSTPEIFVEFNGATCARFGYDAMDIPRLLQSWLPGSRMLLVSEKEIRHLSLNALEASRPETAILWFSRRPTVI